MKKAILLCVVLLAGCKERPNIGPPVSLLRMGMQQYEVEEIYGGPLTFVSFEPTALGKSNYSVAVYRMWSHRPDDPKTIWGTYSTVTPPTPFKLAFLSSPPLTKEQCRLLAQANNVTEPNELAQIMALEGYRPNQLIKVEEDPTAIMIEEARALRGYQYVTPYQRQALTPNAYGLGVHKNRYGQPVILRPDFGPVPGEPLDITPDAYGPGIHRDQYGRPVREYPWP